MRGQLGQDVLIREFRHHSKRPREDEALLILRKIASMVKPIMRQRCWTVGTLSEFYPQNRGLLGMNQNHGQIIYIRLRPHYDERVFLPFEDLVDTMLHELCHNVIGPHNRAFHNLWDQLRDEHEALLIRGYTGEGFLSKGQKLGGSRVPIDEVRRKARASAEQRRSGMISSGQRLGGAPPERGVHISKIRADAAQRRNSVTNGCGDSSSSLSVQVTEEASRNGFRTQAEADDAEEMAIIQALIESIQDEERRKYGTAYEPPSQENPAGPHQNWEKIVTSSRDQAVTPTSPKVSSSEGANNRTYADPWTCPVCTLENLASFLCCDACAAERPIPVSERKSAASDLQKGAKTATTVGRSTPKPPKPPKPAASLNPTANSLKRRHSPDIEEVIEIKDDPPAQGNFAMKNRIPATESLKKLDREVSKRPLGWLCTCSAFMEAEWWTCSACGKMKSSS